MHRPGSAGGPDRGGGEVVRVRVGDTLWEIAAAHLGPGAGNARIAAEWPRWYAANRSVIGPSPDLLRPGQQLRAPTAENDRSTLPRPHSTEDP